MNDSSLAQASHDREEPLDAYSRVVSRIAEDVGAAVVRVEGIERLRRGGLGSGVVIAADGLVLTNSHVVANAKRVRLVLPQGDEVRADVIGDDGDTDLALLRADLPWVQAPPSSAIRERCVAVTSSLRSAIRWALNRR